MAGEELMMSAVQVPLMETIFETEICLLFVAGKGSAEGYWLLVTSRVGGLELR